MLKRTLQALTAFVLLGSAGGQATAPFDFQATVTRLATAVGGQVVDCAQVIVPDQLAKTRANPLFHGLACMSAPDIETTKQVILSAGVPKDDYEPWDSGSDNTIHERIKIEQETLVFVLHLDTHLMSVVWVPGLNDDD